MLVWEEPQSSQEDSSGVNTAHRMWREEFLNRLRHVGLLQEQVSRMKTTNMEESNPELKSTPEGKHLCSLNKHHCVSVTKRCLQTDTLGRFSVRRKDRQVRVLQVFRSGSSGLQVRISHNVKNNNWTSNSTLVDVSLPTCRRFHSFS